MAFIRAAPSYWSWITVITCGPIAAAAMPWPMRAAIRIGADQASPASRDIIVNPASPDRNSRR